MIKMHCQQASVPQNGSNLIPLLYPSFQQGGSLLAHHILINGRSWAMFFIHVYTPSPAPALAKCVQTSPPFQKSTFHHSAFRKDLHYYLFSLTQRNPKRIFYFTKKGWKAKIALSVCFVVSPYYRQWALNSDSGPTKLLTWELHSASSHHSFELGLGATVLYFDLFYASVSKTCPKVILFMLFWFTKGFTGTLSFWIAGQNCTCWTNDPWWATPPRYSHR